MLTWNVGGRGVNGAIKRTRVLAHIKDLKADVIFIQETHLRNISQKQLINQPWIGSVFHSQFDNKTRGAAILIKKNVPFNMSETIVDNNGRYIIVVGTLYQKQLY